MRVQIEVVASKEATWLQSHLSAVAATTIVAVEQAFEAEAVAELVPILRRKMVNLWLG